jgi:predicted nucleic acid-binding protein
VKTRPVYLDVCALCRPFDDQGYARIRLETDAVNLILAKVRDGKYWLAVSPVHKKEIGAVSDAYERFELLSILETFGEPVKTDLLATRSRAEELFARGFGLADAAHVAFAEKSAADFITCDDKLLKQCQRANIGTWCGDPVLFCVKEGLK